ncbi:MAG: hypothetical protein JEZ06_23175 [Anaerolineaceae bacterium]|nr:hypothetical protein [Anaerolineaceae bacterium]
MSKDDLEQAIAMIRAGEKDQARLILKQIITDDPHNEIAWVWFVESMVSINTRLNAVNLWRRIDPPNEKAKKIQKVLEEKISETEEISSVEKLIEIETASPIRERQVPKADPEKKRREQQKNKRRRTIWITFSAVLLLIGIAFFGYQYISKNSQSESTGCLCVETNTYMLRVVKRLEDWKSNQSLFMFLGRVGDVPASAEFARELYRAENEETFPECLTSIHILVLELLDYHQKFAEALQENDTKSADYFLLIQNLKQEELQKEILRLNKEVECIP